MNNLFTGFIKKEVNIIEDNEILSINIPNINIDDTLVNHYYIDELNHDLNEKEITKLILYRIKSYNNFNYIEYYLHIIKCLENKETILENLKHINGRKSIKGNIKTENQKYTIIQVRGNDNFENWVTLWDILINKHYYGEK